MITDTTTHFVIFIVEDDPWYGELLKYHLSLNEDYEVNLFRSGEECLNKLFQKPDVVVMDFGLPDITGDRLLAQVKAYDNTIPVVVISGQEEVAVAVNLLKSGANDYIVKDDNAKELLWNAIVKIKENQALKQEVEVLKEQLEQKFDFGKTIIGQSPAITNTFKLIAKAVNNNINVSITGETGTGKEVVAKAIHYNSFNKKKPFVAVNMAAIPRDLIESELFGYEKGAFTGAMGRKTGKFEEANDGTLFLDEIAELDLNLQSKILRVLQERELERLGGNQPISLSFRLITATHKDLVKEVKRGNFREDLYYRIMGLPIHLPPLRDRGNDVLILAKYFADEFARNNQQKKYNFRQSAKDKLLTYSFPGNIRELKAVIDLACVMCDENEIQADDITFTDINDSGLNHGIAETEKTLKEYTADIIGMFLKKYKYDVLEVANRLNIGKSTIYNMLKSGEIVKET
ncbi:MAG: sigma-54-dependent transcriptional regulator [Candidatus Cyclobacteriaceae bacterium M3_2C_046]